jgi:alcohol dehydrogenase
MRALLVDHELSYQPDYPTPQRTGDEALIRLRLAGICNTDLELVAGYMDFRGVLGHEFVGEVVDAPDKAWIGQRVVGDINAACYTCPTCLAGRHTHCPNRTTLGIAGRDGCLSDYFLLPQANLYRVPDGVPDELAVFAEPLAAACEILEQVHIAPTARIVVLGDGKLGLLVAAVLRLTGAELLLLGRHPEKLALAAAWGVPTGLVAEVQGDHRADVAVECTGNAEGFAIARSFLRARGKLILKSTYHASIQPGTRAFNLSEWVVDEITVLGSRCGPFAPALRLMAAGLVDPRPLISATHSLDDAAAAMEHAAARGVLKVLVRP